MFCVILALISSAVFIKASNLLKLIVLLVSSTVFIVLTMVVYVALYDNRDFLLYTYLGYDYTIYSLKWISLATVLLFTVTLIIHAQQVESTARLDFIWKQQAQEEKEEMAALRTYNMKLVANILPLHVAEHFLKGQNKKDEDLYHQDCENVCVMFATIANFFEFYMEYYNEGVECLRLLNEIIADFDEILGQERFQCIEKIKTTGATYMAASGLTEKTSYADNQHVLAIVEYALAIRDQLQYVNVHCFNNFQMRIGINVGPVVAGVIGARKPQYDIWGNTVNVASRMDSTGELGTIQVTQEIYTILTQNGYTLECRGNIKVKGKGDMLTYLLKGKATKPETENVLSST